MHCFVVILKYWRSTPVVSEPQVYKRNKKVLLVKASKRELLNMNPSDSSSSSQPIHHSTPLCIDRLPSSLKKTLGNKIDQLVEFTHVPEDFRTPATEYPLISPYSFYQRQKKSTLTSIHYLINRNPSPPPKEVIQSYHLQQCDYTHLHLGAVRLILTLHERRSLLITAKVALLDTTFKEYQHALIGALVTTLSNGSVILTIAPNFTMRLSDPTISQRLKIQIQLVGVIQDSNVEQATLHHQVLYRVQDHALDLNLPNTTGKVLFMFIDSAGGPAIVNIPRMITTEELSSIIPLEWITDYEKAFPKEHIDVHTTTPPTITHNSDRTVTTIFRDLE
ncbi:hypothetical protein HN51_050069 [Arachis hypogaea]